MPEIDDKIERCKPVVASGMVLKLTVVACRKFSQEQHWPPHFKQNMTDFLGQPVVSR